MLIPYFYPVLLPSPAAQWDAEEQGLFCAHPQHVFPCIPCLFQPLWLCSCGFNSCRDNSCPEARFCLLIPAGCVLVCIYSQQIPPTACSLAIIKPSCAGRLCSLLHPIFLNPCPLPCSQGQCKGFHMCHPSSFMSPSDFQLHCWEFGSSVPLQPMCRKILLITGSGFSLFLGARGDRTQSWDIGGFFMPLPPHHPPSCCIPHARQPVVIPCSHIQTSDISICFHV